MALRTMITAATPFRNFENRLAQHHRTVVLLVAQCTNLVRREKWEISALMSNNLFVREMAVCRFRRRRRNIA